MRNRGRGRKGGRLIAAVGSAFTPASLNGLTLWLDPYYGTFQERTTVDALLVYSRVLSAAEMLTLHNWAMALSI